MKILLVLAMAITKSLSRLSMVKAFCLFVVGSSIGCAQVLPTREYMYSLKTENRSSKPLQGVVVEFLGRKDFHCKPKCSPRTGDFIGVSQPIPESINYSWNDSNGLAHSVSVSIRERVFNAELLRAILAEINDDKLTVSLEFGRIGSVDTQKERVYPER